MRELLKVPSSRKDRTAHRSPMTSKHSMRYACTVYACSSVFSSPVRSTGFKTRCRVSSPAIHRHREFAFMLEMDLLLSDKDWPRQWTDSKAIRCWQISQLSPMRSPRAIAVETLRGPNESARRSWPRASVTRALLFLLAWPESFASLVNNIVQFNLLFDRTRAISLAS